MILIITSKRDSHVGPVTAHLDASGFEWIRLNTEDLATNVDVDLDPGRGDGRLLIKDSMKQITLGDIGAVWYRKPDPVDMTHFEMNEIALEYVEAEFSEILMGIYALLEHAYWINNPFQTRIAHRKLLQLNVAKSVGFRIPKTILTNSKQRAIQFSEDLQGDLAIKSLGSISITEELDANTHQYGIFTRRVERAELLEMSGKIQHMPTIFQEFVPKCSELRVTCCGSDIHTCEIRPRSSDLTHDDYRFDTANLVHSAASYPELEQRIRNYLAFFQLNFGCFDFIVPHSGEPIFLECNCNGQWYWVEKQTGLPIAETVARTLMENYGRVQADGFKENA